MTDPNLLVESGVEDVGDLVAALRVTLASPAQSVPCAVAGVDDGQRVARRGTCRRAGWGGAGFTFATLYRLRQWTRGR